MFWKDDHCTLFLCFYVWLDTIIIIYSSVHKEVDLRRWQQVLRNAKKKKREWAEQVLHSGRESVMKRARKMNADAQTKIIFEMEIQDWHHLGINLFRRTEYTSQEIDSWAATESKPKLIEFVVAQQRQ